MNTYLAYIHHLLYTLAEKTKRSYEIRFIFSYCKLGYTIIVCILMSYRRSLTAVYPWPSCLSKKKIIIRSLTFTLYLLTLN